MPGLGLIVASGGWALLAGIAGLLLAGLWGLTDHAAAYNNENLLQVNLLALGLLWLVPKAVRGSGTGRRALQLAAIVLAVRHCWACC